MFKKVTVFLALSTFSVLDSVSTQSFKVLTGNTFRMDGVVYTLKGISVPDVRTKAGKRSKKELERLLRKGNVFPASRGGDYLKKENPVELYYHIEDTKKRAMFSEENMINAIMVKRGFAKWLPYKKDD